jgi:hypothetical protein
MNHPNERWVTRWQSVRPSLLSATRPLPSDFDLDNDRRLPLQHRPRPPRWHRPPTTHDRGDTPTTLSHHCLPPVHHPPSRQPPLPTQRRHRHSVMRWCPSHRVAPLGSTTVAQQCSSGGVTPPAPPSRFAATTAAVGLALGSGQTMISWLKA